MSTLLVSGIITTHNRADLLPRALDSVINQTYPNMEVVVVDDGSVDETPQVMQRYQKEHSIKYIRLEESHGPGKARNKGIEEASGIFIAGLDDDDVWHEERISEMVEAYSDDYAFVTSDNEMVYPKKSVVWKKKNKIDLDTLLYTNQVGNQILAKRDRLLEVGGFDASLIAAVEDYDLWIRLCKAFGPIRNVQKPLQTIYMDHEEGRVTDKAFKGFLQFYNKHKPLMNTKQRAYQLYKIRRAQGKSVTLKEFLFRVPPFRMAKELKHMIINRLWK